MGEASKDGDVSRCSFLTSFRMMPAHSLISFSFSITLSIKLILKIPRITHDGQCAAKVSNLQKRP